VALGAATLVHGDAFVHRCIRNELIQMEM